LCMTFEPYYIRFLKGLAVTVLIVTGYLWVSTDEWEFEQQELAEQQRQQQQRITDTESEPEPEPELPQYEQPEQQIPGWIIPPEPVRKKVARVKRKIKKTVKND
jgi:hypothetical protein